MGTWTLRVRYIPELRSGGRSGAKKAVARTVSVGRADLSVGSALAYPFVSHKNCNSHIYMYTVTYIYIEHIELDRRVFIPVHHVLASA